MYSTIGYYSMISVQKRADTPQKRPSHIAEFRYDHIPLPEAFPLFLGDRYVIEDREISYLHTHKHLELGLCHDGSGIFILEDRLAAFSAGDVTFIPGDRYHLARSTPGTRSIWSFVTLDCRNILDLPNASAPFRSMAEELIGGRSFLTKGTKRVITETMYDLIAELRDKERGWEEAAAALVRNLMVKLSRVHGEGRVPFNRNHDPLRERLLPAFQYMMYNYHDEIHSDHIARMCNTSTTNFRRLFRRLTGVTPMRYLARLRVEAAINQLLTTEISMIAIAADTGFNSLASFNRQFKGITGFSPRDWKKRHQPEGIAKVR